jgi:cysteine desulfurase
VTVFCDHNAGSPVRADVAEGVAATMKMGGNPSSVHSVGRKARAALERARAQVANLVGAPADVVVFTGSGSEANNMALAGGAWASIVVSAIEHPSVLAAVPDSIVAPVNADGVLDLAAFEEIIATAPAPGLVSVMLANNETGVLQPVNDVARIAHRYGALVHTDAVQAVGRVALDMARLDTDMLTLSAHKIGGPQGVGALLLKDHVRIEPLIRGGGQEKRRRAGTENVAGIVGFGIAADSAAEDLSDAARVTALRDRLETRLMRTAPDVRFHGVSEGRLGNTSCVGMPGVAGETQVLAFDLAGIALSAGAACSSGKVETSHVLRAMGVSEPAAGEAIRLSFGPTNTDADVDSVAAIWRDLYRRTRSGDTPGYEEMAAVGAAA